MMKKILIIQTASIGDVILATPLLEKLHHDFPGAAIDLLVKKGNESLFTGHPFLNQVLTWDKTHHAFRNFFQLIFLVRKNRYDLTVNVQRFFKTGLLTVLSGASSTVGFDKNPWSFLFSHKVKHQISKGFHEIDRNLALLQNFPGNQRCLPKLYPTSGDETAIQSYKTGIYYTLSPASLWFTKQYPAEQWVSFIRKIPATSAVYLLGSPADRDLCEEILLKSAHPQVFNLSGLLTLLQSAALMQGARMNFTNDSAPMHLASAVNAPVSVVFCSTVPEFGFGPLSDRSFLIQTEENPDCRPCGLHGYKDCPKKHFRCATGIPPEALAEHL